MAVPVFVLSGLVFLREMVRTQQRPTLPNAVVAVLDTLNEHLLLAGGDRWLRSTDPLRTINGYGLFRVMTTERPEIIVEGSRDGVTWSEYGFRFKAGDVTRRPRYAAPHQPRLDWQMWFAALNPSRHERWLLPLARRLLEGAPEVWGLLADHPFAAAPPDELRFVAYRYRFTRRGEDGSGGDWWTREPRGALTGPISLQAFEER